MRKIYLSFLAFFFASLSFAQSTVIGGVSAGSSGNVITGGSTFHVSESIYLDEEIGSSKFIGAGNGIQRIEFAANTNSTATFPAVVPGYSIYMKNVPTANTVFTSGAYSLTDYTLVYSGSLTMGTVGGAQFTFVFNGGVNLTTPFERTVGSNLQVLIVRNSGSAFTGLAYDCSIGNYTAGSSVTSSRRYNSTVAPVAGTTSLTATNFRPAIKLIREISTDVTVQSIVGGPNLTCNPSPFSYSVTIKNNSATNPISIGAATVNLSFSGANTLSSNLTNATSIPANGTEVVTFTGLNASNGGVSTVTAISKVVGDGDVSNDTLRTSFTLSPSAPTSNYPAIESAENNPLDHFLWLRILSGNRNLWGIRQGMKNSNLSDSIPPFHGNICYMFDCWGGTSSDGFTGRLFSNCFSFPANLTPSSYYVRFRMSHDTSLSTYLDSMYLTVSSDKGATWTRLAGFQRYDASFTTAGWKMDSVNLAAYAGQTIQIGFEGVSKFGNVIGLDNIEVNARGTLPVTLTSFTGKKEGRNNILSWSTANELNNKGFEILRSADGKKFSSIGFEASKNNTTTTATNYSFVDEKVLSGVNYYQLKQVDKDGKTSLSNIVVLKSNTNKLEISTVYPNPANDKLNAIISSDKEEKVTVSITDLAGKVVSSQQVVTSNGSTNVFFNLQGLSKGTYLLRLTSTKNNEIQIEKFVKQ